MRRNGNGKPQQMSTYIQVSEQKFIIVANLITSDGKPKKKQIKPETAYATKL